MTGMTAETTESYSINPPPPPATATDSHAGAGLEITDSDVAAIQNGVREAAGEYVNHGESSLYYDAATMSPLNPFSAVSHSPFCSPFVHT
jgi:hypothetical protein